MVTFYPIGKVRTEDGRFFLDMNREIFSAVLGLHEYSHIQVLWWFHLYDGPETRKYFIMDKPYKKGPEKVGVLASRGPVRPNPIAITVCELKNVKSHSLVLDPPFRAGNRVIFRHSGYYGYKNPRIPAQNGEPNPSKALFKHTLDLPGTAGSA